MKLFISGGYHGDPLHRLYLGACMRLLERDLGLPAFIAVEANRVGKMGSETIFTSS